MRFRGRHAIVLIGVAFAAWSLRSSFLGPEPVEVTVFRAAPGPVAETVSNSKAGTVKTNRRASLSPEVGGRVAELRVKKGDRVRAGQILLRLVDTDLEARARLEERSLDTARASQGEACGRTSQAERELARVRKLAEQKIVSSELSERAESDRDVAVSACEASKARVAQAAAALDFARAQLAKTTLRAPFDGVVAELRCELGEWITPSPTGIMMPPVADLIDASSVYVTAPLDEVDIARLKVGQAAKVTLDALPGRSFTGRVRRVAPYVVDVEKQNRTFDVDVDVDPAAFTGPDAVILPPGASADIEVILQARDAAVRVPSHAVSELGRVLVLRDGVLVEQTVKTGIKGWEFTEVTSGLAAGDAVVTSLDKAEVKPGAKAREAGTR